MKKTVIFISVPLICFLFVLIYSALNKTTLGETMQELTTEVITQPHQQVSFSIDYLKSLTLTGSDITIEQTLSDGSNYKRYLASYISDNHKIYGLLTVPKTEMPEGGYRAIVFDHGYIPPKQYVTTEKYVAYVDNLARAGFVVFKIDFRGNGNSEGSAGGSYFSNGYTLDTINAVKSLQKLSYVNAERIGAWGHSMSGNVVLRSMLVSDAIKAGVIWAGAVYSYEDMAKYRINDNSYVRATPSPSNTPRVGTTPSEGTLLESTPSEVLKLRRNEGSIDFSLPFWKSVSLTQNINYLTKPLQLNHAKNDTVVNIGYSRDLAHILAKNNKVHEFYEYDGGGHNIDSPYFEQAMRNTIEFYDKHL